MTARCSSSSTSRQEETASCGPARALSEQIGLSLVVMMYIRYPLSLRQVEDILFERGLDICHETVRFWWNRFGPMFANEIRKRRLHHRSFSQWRWQRSRRFVAKGIVRANSFTLPKRQNRISRPLIFLHFSGSI